MKVKRELEDEQEIKYILQIPPPHIVPPHLRTKAGGARVLTYKAPNGISPANWEAVKSAETRDQQFRLLRASFRAKAWADERKRKKEAKAKQGK
jgi:hypothetical protein